MKRTWQTIPIGGKIKEPGSSKDFKTGGWALLEPHWNKKKCSKCLTCVNFCPENCISFKNNKVKINYNYCKGCGICARECPEKAITMKLKNNNKSKKGK